MIAGSDTANGRASSLTDAPGSSASRITSARRVGSASAAKVRSSGELETLTMWLSIGPGAAVSTALAKGADSFVFKLRRHNHMVTRA
jgi:hypothetical protein